MMKIVCESACLDIEPVGLPENNMPVPIPGGGGGDGSSIVTEDSDTIHFSGDGTTASPLTAEAIIGGDTALAAGTTTTITGDGTGGAPYKVEVKDTYVNGLIDTKLAREVDFDIGIILVGQVQAGQYALAYKSSIAWKLVNLNDIQVFVDTLSAALTLKLFKGATQIGSITINTDGTQTHTFTAEVDFAVGEVFTAKAVGAASMNVVAVTIIGLRTISFNG
jgi:hypothetical protein